MERSLHRLVTVALVGLLAQFVDGALGMAYGLCASSLLVASGMALAGASASVHLAEMGTTLVSGVAHARLGNVDWRLTAGIAGPGFVGAFAGSTVLSAVDGPAFRPVIAALLVVLGLRVLWLAFRPRPSAEAPVRPPGPRSLGLLGLGAGFVDAIGGGGWGPVAVPSLLAAGGSAPRQVIGSVSASEFLVTLGASVGFVASLGWRGVDKGAALALLIGGVVAAPVAAWVVRRAQPRWLAAWVGALVVVLNLRILLSS